MRGYQVFTTLLGAVSFGMLAYVLGVMVLFRLSSSDKPGSPRVNMSTEYRFSSRRARAWCCSIILAAVAGHLWALFTSAHNAAAHEATIPPVASALIIGLECALAAMLMARALTLQLTFDPKGVTIRGLLHTLTFSWNEVGAIVQQDLVLKNLRVRRLAVSVRSLPGQHPRTLKVLATVALPEQEWVGLLAALAAVQPNVGF